eukprot:1159481-Pelagomonas_calceolata.AAC.3
MFACFEHTFGKVFNDRVNDIADRLFKPFSERLGLSSIREYEEQHQEFEARTEAEKARLTAQLVGKIYLPKASSPFFLRPGLKGNQASLRACSFKRPWLMMKLSVYLILHQMGRNFAKLVSPFSFPPRLGGI